MSFTEAVRSCLRQYAGFEGRAGRAEFWWFFLLQYLVVSVPLTVGLLALAAGIGLAAEEGTQSVGLVVLVIGGILTALTVLASFGLLLPSIAVAVRRLHDTDRSGLWYLISFVPGGSYVVLVFALLAGTPGPNQYGHGPGGPGVAHPPYGQWGGGYAPLPHGQPVPLPGTSPPPGPGTVPGGVQGPSGTTTAGRQGPPSPSTAIPGVQGPPAPTTPAGQEPPGTPLGQDGVRHLV